MGPYMGQQLAKLALKMDVDINLEDYDIKSDRSSLNICRFLVFICLTMTADPLAVL